MPDAVATLTPDAQDGAEAANPYAPFVVPEPTPAPAPAPAAADNDNPYQQFIDHPEPSASAQRPGLWERLLRHIRNSELETPLGEARYLGDSAVERAARESGRVAELDNEAIDRAIQTREDHDAYNRMPGAEGFLERGAAVAGSLIGGARDPSMYIGQVMRLPALAARGALGRMAEVGVNQAIVNSTFIDPATQALGIASGMQESWDKTRTFLYAPATGFAFGAGIRGLGEAASLFVKSPIEKDAKNFLTALRDNGDAETAKLWPEYAKAVEGKTDEEIAVMAKEAAKSHEVARAAVKTREPLTGDAIWRHKDGNFPVELMGEPSEIGPDGRLIQRVLYGEKEIYVPVDELVRAGKAPKAGEAAPKAEPAPEPLPPENVTHPASEAGNDTRISPADVTHPPERVTPAGETVPAEHVTTPEGRTVETPEGDLLGMAAEPQGVARIAGVEFRGPVSQIERLEQARKAGADRAEIERLVAQIKSESAAPTAAPLQGRIIDAYQQASGGQFNKPVSLVELRRILSDVPREALDAELKRMHVTEKLHATLSGNNNPASVTAADRSASIAAFGGDKHFLWISADPRAAVQARPIGERLADEFHANEGTTPEVLGMAVRQFEGSQTRQPVIPGVTVPAPSQYRPGEAPNIRNMWMDLAESLDATVRKGRMRLKTAAGEYDVNSGVIRMKQIDDPVVLAHEVGHHLEDQLGAPLKAVMTAHAPELRRITAYAAGQANDALRLKEGFAEFLRLSMENPYEAASRAPNFDAAFRTFLETQPEVRDALQRALVGFEKYRTADPADIIDANVASAKVPTAWQTVKADIADRGYTATIYNRGSMVYAGLFDELNALNTTVRSLARLAKEREGGAPIELLAADDAYKLRRLATNASNAGLLDAHHGVAAYHGSHEGASLFDAVALATGKPNVLSGFDEAAYKSFGGYLTARRAIFEWERHAAGFYGTRDPTPFPKEFYERKIAVYEAQNPNAQDAASMVHEWARNMLRKEYEAGLITGESYNNALQIRDYVPWMRDRTDLGGATGGGGFDAGTVGLKKTVGSSRPIINPVDSLLERGFRTAELIAFNDTIKALATLADRAGVGAGKLVERIPAKEIRGTQVDPLEVIYKSLIDQGENPADAKLATAHIGNMISANGQPLGPVSIFRPQTTTARGENIVLFLEGGKLQGLRLESGEFGQELADILTSGLSAPLRDWNLKLLTGFSRILRAGVTTDPSFLITNLIKDQTAAWIMNKGYLPFIDAARGIAWELTNNDLAKVYNRYGGVSGGINVASLDRAQVHGDIQALAKKGWSVARLASWDALFRTVELAETGTRLGIFGNAYKRAIKQGLTEHQAAVEATFQAVDFIDWGRHGSRIGTTMKLVPFFNANMQGVDKAYRAMASPFWQEQITKGDVEATKNAYRAWSKTAALTSLSMALRAAYIDDPEYDEISDYLRNTHWAVRVPGLKSGKVVNALGQEVEVPRGMRGLWVVIPKTYELGIPMNLGERAVEALYHRDPKALATWAWGALDLVSQHSIADTTGLRMVYEMGSGWNFFNHRPIVPERLRGVEPYMQATAATSTLSRKLAEEVNAVQKELGGEGGGFSPMMLDHFLKGTGGSWARTVLALTDQAMGEKGDRSLADTAVAQRMFKEASRGSKSVTVFYDAVARETGSLSRAANSYDKFLKSPAPQAAEEYFAKLSPDKKVWVTLNKSNFSADEKRVHPLHRAQDAESVLSGMALEIASNGLMTEDKKGRTQIQMTPSERSVAGDVMSRLRMWEARNALIAADMGNMKGHTPGNVQAEYDMLRETAPKVYNELAHRYAQKKIYKYDAVAEAWPDVKQQVEDYGSAARFQRIARGIERQGYELDAKRQPTPKQVKPPLPGKLTVPPPTGYTPPPPPPGPASLNVQ